MPKEYVMPKLAMAMNEGTINEWLVKNTEWIEAGAPLATVETEKVSYDCESPETGYIAIVANEADTVPCDTVIAYFCESAEEAESLSASADNIDENESETVIDEVEENTSSQAAKTESPMPQQAPVIMNDSRIIASPLAKKMAKDENLNLRLVSGTGPGGRIVKKDVLAALKNGLQLPTPNIPATADQELARIPLTGMRKTIAERMTQSLSQSAQLSSAWGSDITDLLAMRRKLLEKESVLGTRISVNAFIIKAICYAIKQVPIANACKEGDEIIVRRNVHMGIAIALPGATEYESGLMVAVLRNADSMGLKDLDINMKDLIERTKAGKASQNELSGSTITLSSTAGIAPPGMTTTPVLNQPNAALVGPSSPIERPMIKDGEVAVRTMMPVSFTFDHCILDGEPAARFMKALHDALETPELLLA